MGRIRALPLLLGAVAGGLLVSGASGADPRTPAALPGRPAPFLGIAVVGSGGLLASADASFITGQTYVVDGGATAA